MSNQQFHFPPPPPPPPQAPIYDPQPPDRSRGGFNDRSNRGSSGHHGRGRGNNRGGSRGGYAGNLGHASGYGGYPPRDQRGGTGPNNQPNNYGGGSYPLPDYPKVQQPHYPPSVYNAYNQPAAQYPPSQPYPHPHYQSYPSYPTNGQPSAPAYDAALQNHPYGYAPPSHSVQPRTSGHASQPVMMGPPIHIGHDGRPTDQRAPPFGYHDIRNVNRMPLGNNSPRSSGSIRHHSPNPFPARGKKRNRSEAFRQPKDFRPNLQAAPAVPSFGNPLPVNLPIKPPGSGANSKKRKKKRRHNQLGLTPKTEDHESSEEEDDHDEEAKLAAAAGGQLQFTFRGQTSTLQSSSEIAEWISERKKKFPTQARAAEAAERKRRNEEEQRAARQAAKESQEKRRAEARAKQDKQKAEALQAREEQTHRDGVEPTDTVKDTEDAKAQSKLEKLRRRLKKEEKRVAKALAKASKAKPEAGISAEVPILSTEEQEWDAPKPVDDPEGANGPRLEKDTEILAAFSEKNIGKLQTEVEASVEQCLAGKNSSLVALDVPDKTTAESSTAPNPLTPTSQPSLPDPDTAAAPNQLSLDEPMASAEPALEVSDHLVPPKHAETDEESNMSMLTSSSDISTSSEGDDDTSSSDESSSSDDAPELATSKRTAPDKILPPKREKPKAKEICRNYLNNGRCPRDDNCKFRHELPEKGQKSKTERQAKADEPKERKGLYQRLVEQEKEQEDKQILDTIVHLGERGLLTEPVQQGSDSDIKPS